MQDYHIPEEELQEAAEKFFSKSDSQEFLLGESIQQHLRGCNLCFQMLQEYIMDLSSLYQAYESIKKSKQFDNRQKPIYETVFAVFKSGYQMLSSTIAASHVSFLPAYRSEKGEDRNLLEKIDSVLEYQGIFYSRSIRINIQRKIEISFHFLPTVVHKISFFVHAGDQRRLLAEQEAMRADLSFEFFLPDKEIDSLSVVFNKDANIETIFLKNGE